MRRAYPRAHPVAGRVDSSPQPDPLPLSGERDRWEAEVASTRLVVGAGRLQEVGELARELGARRVLLVSDPGLRRAGHVETARGAIEGAGCAVAVFDQVAASPTTRDVDAGVAFARAAVASGPAIDFVVALGGGSAMDAAKGINFLLTNGGRMEDYWGFGRAAQPLLPALAVPTTAGTGSDAQSFAVIADAETHRKMACGDRKARFRAALLDPALLASAPPEVRALAGFDALSHVVESWVTTRRNPVSAMLGREAWRRLEPAFAAALQDSGDLALQSRLLVGAHLAGAAIEASMLGGAHAAANPLTARYGIPHGAAVGLMLPSVVRRNGATAADLYAELAPGAGAAAGERLAARLEALRDSAGLPARLAEAGVERGALPELAAAASREWTGGFNPVPLDAAAFLALYEAAW